MHFYRSQDGVFIYVYSAANSCGVTVALTAMLCKEIYASALSSFLFLYSFYHKRYRLSGLIVVVAISYACYRTWALGLQLVATQPLLGISEYGEFLLRLPFSFSANIGAYILLLSWIIMFSRYCRSNSIDTSVIIFFMIMLIVTIGSIYPVSYPLKITITNPGTWYRVAFLINTTCLLFGGYLVARFIRGKWLQIFTVLVAVVLTLGAVRTHNVWDHMLNRSYREAQFYLQNPEKLLYSQEPAYWFIPGVHKMYAVPNLHYIHRNNLDEHNRQMTTQFSSIWRDIDGTFKPDPDLYRELAER
jgi:hypothetical protein